MINVDKNFRTEKFGDEGYGFDVCCDVYSNKEKIICYSFGIGEDLSFSRALAERFLNCEIFAFDPTPKAIAYVETYDKSVFSHFDFYHYGLSDNEDKTMFYLPKNPGYVSGSEIEYEGVDAGNMIEVQMHSLGYLMRMLNHTSIDLLKMDIEGSEFKVLPQILDEGIEIRQICVEFHNRFFSDGDKQLEMVLEKMQNSGYLIIKVSEQMEEFTFIHSSVLL